MNLHPIATIRRLWFLAVGWFQPAPRIDTPPPLPPRRVPVAEPPSPAAAIPERPPVLLPPRNSLKRDKWVTPKGLHLLRPQPRPNRAPPDPDKPKRERRKVEAIAAETSPEQYGQYFFRNTILDQLDLYFHYLSRIRKSDPDGYDLHRRLGFQVIPADGLSKEEDAGTRRLSPWWMQNRPGFGGVAYGVQIGNEWLEKNAWVDNKGEEYLVNPANKVDLAGKERLLCWTPKFLYFTKYARTPVSVEQVGGGDVYKMTIIWDRARTAFHGTKKHNKGGIPQEYGVVIDDQGNVRVLRMLLRDVQTVRGRHGKNRGHSVSIPNTHWGIPMDYVQWAARHGQTAEIFLRDLFIEATLVHESAAMGSIIRVAVTKGKLTATFGVDIKRTPYFFRDRDVTVTESGTRKRIFHIVRAHERNTKHGKRFVRFHFRGLRAFHWADYQVSITVPGRDHFMLQEFDVGVRDDISRGLSMQSIGEFLATSIERGDMIPEASRLEKLPTTTLNP